MAASSSYAPRWARELHRFLPLKGQFVLSGNVRDLQIVEPEPGLVMPVTLIDALDSHLSQAGFSHTIVFDPVDGFWTTTTNKQGVDAADNVLRELGLTPSNGRAAGGLQLLDDALSRVANYQGNPIALVVDFASRLIVRNDSLSDHEQRLFTRGLLLAHHIRARPFGPESRPFFNPVFWVVEKESDLPDWFLIGNPAIRHIAIAKPDNIARRAVAPALINSMPGASNASESQLVDAQDTFVDETEDLLLVDLKAISQLAREESVSVVNIGEAVRRYKIGVTEDPWKKIDRRKIRNADEFIQKRVKGQHHAVTHITDILKRAITGVGASKSGKGPRGVAFLAGPTGVGKTELAKTVTELLFGDDSAYIRFDMSEFSAEHSDQRLIGAPPGYVGYDEGGELTNAVREKPFSVVLFDEIEKAHPRILDKFLQILDDGVLTSGRGERVYFSESLILFTSNLGIYKVDESGDRVQNVSTDDDFDDVREKILDEIDRYFKVVLNRPEILNRLGENLIVFDFIRPDVAKLIFEHMIASILRGVSEKGVSVEVSDSALADLEKQCLADLSNGGRGIRNQLEAHLINPLARALFDQEVQEGVKVLLTSINVSETTVVELRQSD